MLICQKKKNLKLWDAVDKEDVKKVKKLLQIAGVNPCAKVKGKERTALHEAARNEWKENSENILEILLSSGKVKDVNVLNDKKWTPFMFTCINNNANGAILLVQHGADVTIRDDCGEGVLHKAAFGGSVDMLKYCLELNSGDVNELGVRMRTPLMNVCLSKVRNYLDAIDFLLSSGADVNMKDANGHTAAWYAGDDENIIQLFFKHQQEMKTPSAAVTAEIPTGFSAMSLENRRDTNPGRIRVANIIKRVLPDERKTQEVLSVIDNTGIDLNNFKSSTLFST